jgi:hypothetical protein
MAGTRYDDHGFAELMARLWEPEMRASWEQDRKDWDELMTPVFALWDGRDVLQEDQDMDVLLWVEEEKLAEAFQAENFGNGDEEAAAAWWRAARRAQIVFPEPHPDDVAYL